MVVKALLEVGVVDGRVVADEGDGVGELLAEAGRVELVGEGGDLDGGVLLDERGQHDLIGGLDGSAPSARLGVVAGVDDDQPIEPGQRRVELAELVGLNDTGVADDVLRGEDVELVVALGADEVH